MAIGNWDNDLWYRFICKITKSTKQHSSLQNYISLTLFSILLAVAISQVISCQFVSGSKISMDKGLSLDNVTSSSLTSSTNNLSENEGQKMGSFPKIHIHMSGEKGIFVNGYLVETANGVVAIDSALTVSESKALKAQLDSINKPLLAVLLTHPHPDHVAGVTYLVPPKTHRRHQHQHSFLLSHLNR